MYLNGNLEAGPTADTPGSPANMSIGVDGGSYFNGSLDDVRIYNRALSADDIAMLYNGGNGTEVDS